MALQAPVAVTITSLELIVLDALATCNDPDASGGSEILRVDLVLGESRQLQVSAGLRTFSVIAYDADTPVARGCDTVDLIAGRTNEVSIQLVEYPPQPDAGPDSGDQPDGGPADAGPTDGDVPGPLNDICATAEGLVAGLSVPGTLIEALDHSSTSCVAAGARDVFYAIDATGWTEPQSVLIQVSSGGLNTAMALRGADCSTELACASATNAGETLDIPVLQPGSIYYVVVEGVGGVSGDFNIGYTLGPARPINDHCDGAQTLTSGVAVTGATITAARDDQDGSCGTNNRPDVAFRFTVPAGPDQRARVTVSNATFDPALHLHTGGCGGTEIGCAQATGAAEVLDLPSLAAGDYWLWVEANDNGSGTFDILLELLPEVPPPGNDICTGAETLTAGTTDTGNSTVGAADDYGLSCTAGDGRDTVHALTLGGAAALLVTVTPQPGPWNLAAELRAAASCATGPAIACEADRFPVRHINCKNLPGGGYDVLIDGDGGAAGDYDIRFDTRAADSSFGYWIDDRTGQTFTSIAGSQGATQVAITTTSTYQIGADEWSMPITLPFTFPFHGTSYNTIHAVSNGYLTFSAQTVTYLNDCPLDTTAPTEALVPFWDDAISTTASQLWTRLDGQAPARRFIIEYRNFDLLQCTNNCQANDVVDVNLNHQVILHENGDIQYRYGPRTASNIGCTGRERGCSATVGIEGQGGTDVDQVQCDSIANPVIDGRVITFIHPSSCN